MLLKPALLIALVSCAHGWKFKIFKEYDITTHECEVPVSGGAQRAHKAVGSADHPRVIPAEILNVLEAEKILFPSITNSLRHSLGCVEFSDMKSFQITFYGLAGSGTADRYDARHEDIGIPWKDWTSYYVEDKHMSESDIAEG
ncbi:Uu.00g000930.m01.CDS01 [Anthostomella pinea]|uniref:Uu.00g000930.m01.CDS01 n=1 Tax=Anthostomella pinea TaxID=933095 RepID=A0AAI8VJ73_9PEZI|nr:Uu.00g000930.m01.CDS01 [Anthostomella pinea]